VYASYVGQFDRYTDGGGLGSLGEAFGLILFFVFWVYYSGVVFIIGALIALEYEKQHYTAGEAAAPHGGAGAEGEAQQPERPAPDAPPGDPEVTPPSADGPPSPPGNGRRVSSSEPSSGSSSSAPPPSA